MINKKEKEIGNIRNATCHTNPADTISLFQVVWENLLMAISMRVLPSNPRIQ